MTRLVNSEDMAHCLGRSPNGFRSFIALGGRDLPRYKVPGRLARFFNVEEAVTFLRERAGASEEQLSTLRGLSREYEGSIHA